MCTAATFRTRDFYFGRTLDYDLSYGDEIVITPRHFPLYFLEKGTIGTHYAMIGMACVMDGAPLYYEAANEKGLCTAGLNFVGNARYFPHAEGKDNIAQFELIPWLLGQCASVKEARRLLGRLNLLDAPFRADLPAARLHWLIADRDEAVAVESVASGLMVYDDPVGVLTNDPPFPVQLFALNNYRHVTSGHAEDRFAPGLTLDEYSRGLGALGLPGDLSSQSRFVRAAFTRMNSRSDDDELSSVSQFFHILGSVDQQRGCCEVGAGKYEITLYTSCCNASKGIYYYTTYDNHQISAVDMHRVDLDGCGIVRYAPVRGEHIYMQN